MSDPSIDDTGGGFMPPASSASPVPSPSQSASSPFPKQREHPLRSGSIKEADVINFIDGSILSINRRHAKKFSRSYEGLDQPASEAGYDSFKQVSRDIGTVVDFLWVTGTRMHIPNIYI